MKGWSSDNAGNHIPPKSQKPKVSGVRSSINPSGIIKHVFLKRNEFVEINRANVDDVAADEISLYVLNDGDFYRRVIIPNSDNIVRRMLRNDFEKNYLFTKKTFLDHIGKEAIDCYEKEFGTPSNPMRINPDTRRAIAQQVAEKIYDQAREEVRYKNDPKLKFLIEKKTGEREEYLESKNNIAKAMENF